MLTHPHGRPNLPPHPPAGPWQSPAQRKPRLLRPGTLVTLLAACAVLGVGGGAGLVWATSTQQEEHPLPNPEFSPVSVSSHAPPTPAAPSAPNPSTSPVPTGTAAPLPLKELPLEVGSFFATLEGNEGAVYQDRKGHTIYPTWASRDSGIYHADKKRAKRFLPLEGGFCGSVDKRPYCAIIHPSDPTQTLHFWSPDLSIAELSYFVEKFGAAWRAEHFSPVV